MYCHGTIHTQHTFSYAMFIQSIQTTKFYVLDSRSIAIKFNVTVTPTLTQHCSCTACQCATFFSASSSSFNDETTAESQYSGLLKTVSCAASSDLRNHEINYIAILAKSLDYYAYQ